MVPTREARDRDLRRDPLAGAEMESVAGACHEASALSRRALLGGAVAGLSMWGFAPRAVATARDPRLLVVILRGAIDGLSVVAPTGDPHYLNLRGALALTRRHGNDDGGGGGFALDEMFTLNPAMGFLNSLYQKREALIVHAVATPYRGRSHFDGQDVLETGLAGVGQAAGGGWLNRAIGHLEAGRRADTRGLALAPVVPLIMRGAAPVLSWSPRALRRDMAAATVERLMDLYAHTDPKLHSALAKGMAIERMAAAGAGGQAAGLARGRGERALLEVCEAATRLLTAADGPRIGALSVSGWDTHANEGAMKGQLFNRLGGLDFAIQTLAEGLGAGKSGTAWRETVIVLVTEFGRTARGNGSGGTDHGTGTIAVLLGGAVAGRRVIADWPGLGERALFEGRDLSPTMDLRSVLKGTLSQHLGLSQRVLGETVFPGSSGVAEMKGLIG